MENPEMMPATSPETPPTEMPPKPASETSRPEEALADEGTPTSEELNATPEATEEQTQIVHDRIAEMPESAPEATSEASRFEEASKSEEPQANTSFWSKITGLFK